MEQDRITAAKSRAADVVNGFKCVTERNARDALKLAEHIEAMTRELRAKDRQIDAMKRRMLADDLLRAAKPRQAIDPLGDFFKGIGL